MYYEIYTVGHFKCITIRTYVLIKQTKKIIIILLQIKQQGFIKMFVYTVHALLSRKHIKNSIFV